MTKAFVFGKFLPFHKGHEAMINFACSKCDFLTVLVCASDKEKLSGETRQQWIRQTFQNVSNLEVRLFNYQESKLPNTSVSSKKVSAVWAKIFEELFPDYDLLVTSEPYGRLVAETMKITHIDFNLDKKLVPVSATKIRANIFSTWQFLPDRVKQDLALKVVILGTESTGKTTLTEKLAAYFQCSYVPETGREIISDSTNFIFNDLQLVAVEHAKNIDNALRGNSPLIIIDTDIHITKSYSRFIFATELKVSESIYSANRAQLYLYLHNDAPYHQDGTRLNEAKRNLLDVFHRQTLRVCGIEFIEIQGSWEQRFDQAVVLINNLIETASHRYQL